MADFEKQVSLIEVDVDTAAARKNVDDLTSAILAQKDAVKANTDEIKSLEKQNKALQKEVNDGTKTQEEANKQIEANSKRAFELKKANESVKDGIKDLNKERQNAVKVSKLQSNSLDALRKKSVDLKKALNSQETATKTGAEAFNSIQSELKETNDRIKELDQGAGDFKTTIGDYPQATDEASKGFQLFGTSLDGVFKMILANPIVLLLAGLTSLIAIFKDTQTGAEFFRKSTAALNTAMGLLKDGVEETFGAITEAIEDPQKAFDDLVTTIKEGVLKYFTEFIPAAIDKVVAGFGLLKDALFNLDLDAATEGAKTLFDGLTDLEPVSALVKKGFEAGTAAAKDFAEAVNESTRAAFELEEQLIANEKARADQEVVVAQSIASQKELNRIIEDQSLTFEERIAAAQEFAAVEQAQVDESVKLAEERLRILKAQNDLTNSTEEDIQRVRDAEIELANLRAASDERQLTNSNKLFAIEQQQIADIEKQKADQLANQEKRDAKLAELSALRLEQERAEAIASAETEEEKLAIKRGIAQEDFDLRMEQLAEQEEQLSETEFENAEERAIAKAEIDIAKEQAEAEHRGALEKINTDAEKIRETNAQKAEKTREKNAKKSQDFLKSVAQLGQQGVAAAFELAANAVEIRFDKRQNNLKKQLETGQITEEEFARKSEELEKNKATTLHKIEVKKFKVQKATDLASAGVAIALGISRALALGPILGPILAGVTAASGAIQIAAIATRQPPPAPTFAQGGDVFGMTVGGKPHSAGGTKYRGEDGNVFEVEKDEGIFVTKREATNPALMLLDQVNQMHGGNSMFSGSGRFLQQGGEAAADADLDAQTELITAAVAALPSPVIEASSFMAALNADREATEVGTI